jgi:S-DNA-T family DNA segregation ATPase FtsK/SpoIIIE
MPIKKPASPRKQSSRPQTKAVASRPAARTRKPPARPPERPPTLSFWERLSPERRLDVIGTILAAAGALIFLGLLSANRSILVGGAILFLSQLFGRGIYVLPLGLLVFGLWLVFRKIERIPLLSLERALGSLFLFLWLLTLLHAFAANPAEAEAVALTGRGGGYLGSVFHRLLWTSLGSAGALIAMLAWFMIALAMTLDISVQELFRWLGPLFNKLRLRISVGACRPGRHLGNAFQPRARHDHHHQRRGGDPLGLASDP